MYYCIIDSLEDYNIVALVSDGMVIAKKKELVKKSIQPKYDRVLFLLDSLLKKKELTTKDLDGIVVTTGPGPFTRLRSCVAIANALGFALNIPVLGYTEKQYKNIDACAKHAYVKLKKTKAPHFAIVHYGADPRITPSKKWEKILKK